MIHVGSTRFTGTVQGDGGLLGDTVGEVTADAGVTVDGVLVKDGTVDGVDVSGHAARHMPGGADILQVSATDRFLGRVAAGAGDVQEMGPIVARALLNVEDGAEVNVVDSVFGRTGAVVAATDDYTWAQIDKTTSSLADLTTRAITDLSDVTAKTGTGATAVFSDSPTFTTQITTPKIYSNSDILIDAYNLAGDRTLQIYNSAAGQCNVTIDGTLAVAQAVTVPILNVTAGAGTDAIVLDSGGTYSTSIQSQTVLRDTVITLPAGECELAGLGISQDWTGHQIFSFIPGSISIAQRIQHQGDTDTYVEFTSDAIALYTGAILMLSLNEAITGSSVVVNDGGADVDFTVEGDTSQYLLQCDAGHDNVTINAQAVSANYDLMLAGDGVLGLKETETPTADTDYGKLYTKNDNKLYFQDGAGTEHEVAFV